MDLEQALEDALQDIPWSDSLPPTAYHYANGLPPITEAAKDDVRRAFSAAPQGRVEAFLAEHGEKAPEAFTRAVHNLANLRALERTLALAKAIRGGV